ncbi:MAG: outer membrane lipoprotein carrier protein LolA [Marinifilaceae bacterium]|jgi:outer membrane lipoprotein-sorting protein|nr:outer membrane lipoprotein carrier protein LolA [Marinifilaceae bacterium]
MKLNLLIAILLFLGINTNAQQVDKSKSILNKLSIHNKKHSSITANFVFTLDNKEEDIKESSNGKIIIKGNKYSLEFMGAETYFDGTNLYTYMKETEEVNISIPDDEDGEDAMMNPATIFSIYEKGFKSKYIKKDGLIDVIELIPTEDNDVDFSKIKIRVDMRTKTIKKLVYFGDDGNIITIRLTKFVPNHIYPDERFLFNVNAYPDVEVIDMR